MRYLIRIADDALESLALAAIEACCLGDGQGRDFEQVETFGYLWGHRKISLDLTTIFIAKASVNISARRGDSYVIPNPQALPLKDNFVARWSPHFAFLGGVSLASLQRCRISRAVTRFRVFGAGYRFIRWGWPSMGAEQQQSDHAHRHRLPPIAGASVVVLAAERQCVQFLGRRIPVLAERHGRVPRRERRPILHGESTLCGYVRSKFAILQPSKRSNS